MRRRPASGLAILRAFHVDLKLLGNLEIAEITGLPKSTISRLTYTLTQLGYLRYREEFGKYELAASLLESVGSRFEHSTSVANARRLVYLKLMEKHQNTDPFKFIIYSGKISEQTPQMASGK